MDFLVPSGPFRTTIFACFASIFSIFSTTDRDVAAPVANEASASVFSARDVGQYAAVPWGDPSEPIVDGSPQDRVRDLNMAVATQKLTDEVSEELLDYWDQLADWGQEQNKKLLLSLYFWNGRDRYRGRMEKTEVYWNRLDQFLQGLQSRGSLAACQGIVLAEENIHYNGRPEVLTELYWRIKDKYDIAVWQWWSPIEAVPASGGWIPADGWVVDPYFLPNPDFRQYIRKYVVSGKPVVVMPWASAELEGYPPMTPEQWEINNDQLDVAVEFNLPVAFFWTYQTGTQFGCDRDSPPTDEISQINQWVWDYIERVRALPEDYSGLSTADEASIAPLTVVALGTTGVIYQEDFASQKCIDDVSMTGFRDLKMDGQTLSARGYLGRRVATTLTYHFVSDFPLKYPSASLSARITNEYHGKVKLALSTDGRTWQSNVSTREEGWQTLSCVSDSDPRFARVKELWVQIQLSGDAGSVDDPPVSIDDLHIEVVPPRARTR